MEVSPLLLQYPVLWCTWLSQHLVEFPPMATCRRCRSWSRVVEEEEAAAAGDVCSCAVGLSVRRFFIF